MKNLIAAIVSFVSVSAFACPNLTGHFICKDFDSGAVQDVVMTQTVAGAVTTYKMTLTADGKTSATDFIADGVLRNVDRPDYSSRTVKSYCDGANLKTEINAVRKDNGEVLKVVELVTINAAGDMYDSYIGKQGNKDINFEEVCKRAN